MSYIYGGNPIRRHMVLSRNMTLISVPGCSSVPPSEPKPDRAQCYTLSVICATVVCTIIISAILKHAVHRLRMRKKESSKFKFSLVRVLMLKIKCWNWWPLEERMLTHHSVENKVTEMLLNLIYNMCYYTFNHYQILRTPMSYLAKHWSQSMYPVFMNKTRGPMPYQAPLQYQIGKLSTYRVSSGGKKRHSAECYHMVSYIS